MFVTSEGHPGARLRRGAIAAGNLIAAEQAAFEIPFIPLAEARALVELYAEKGGRKFERAALKYLRPVHAPRRTRRSTDVAQVAALLAERRPAHAWALNVPASGKGPEFHGFVTTDGEASTSASQPLLSDRLGYCS